jgi:glycosyltransferase involved in cell wall biosynthesis
LDDHRAPTATTPAPRHGEPPLDLTGFVEQVNARFVEGWVDCDGQVDLALVVDGVPLATQPADLVRVDAVEAGYAGAKGFRFYTAACKLTPGAHMIEVFPVVAGVRCHALRGVGVAHTAFDLDIAPAAFPSPSVLQFLIENHALRPEIRRFLVADPGTRLRPDAWDGDVIFVDGLPGSHTTRYRITNIAEEMLALGYDCCTLEADELWRLESGAYAARVVQFVRCPLAGGYARAAAAARHAGARIGFDMDDLAFEPGLMPYIDGLRMLDQTSIEQYQAGMLHYRAFLREADFVTVPTGTLRDAAAALNPNAHVVVNSISRRAGAVAYGQTPRNPDVVRIGYYSGTRTHQADFGAAAGALLETMRAHPCVRLRVAGELDLAEFNGFAAVEDQIELLDAMPYPDMLRDMAACDIIIAPLELDNPYCAAKSELKFFEGVLTGCAVVASPTGPFRGAITDGETGCLAGTPREWRAALDALVRDPEHRRGMNQAARERVLDRYAACNAAAAFLLAAGLVEQPAAAARGHGPASLPHRPGSPVSIGFVLPAVTIGSGGLRKVLRICYDLERFGHRISLYVVDGASALESQAAIRRHYYPFAGPVFRYNGTVGQHDFLVATAWETAYAVRRHCPDASRAAYFVQDFEPMFMPVGTGYLKALATYGFGFHLITFGAWIAARLRHDLGLESSVIRFPLNHQAYFPAPGPVRKGKSVLLFARPSQERRAFDLAVGALALVARRLRDVQIGFYGEQSYAPVPFEYTNHGLITSEAALGGLYRATTVGVCLSPTNPSMVAYEMIACGTALVDLRLPGAEVNFDGMDVPFLAMPTEQALAEAIIAAVSDDAARAAKVAVGLRYAATMEDEESVAVMFERHILGFAGAAAGVDAPAPDGPASLNGPTSLNGTAPPPARPRRRQAPVVPPA